MQTLRRKVKTHMIAHLVADVERHGPPKSFNEDAFEKKHAEVRNQIFSQNQKARSRDTAKAFAELQLLRHVVTGGYFPTDNGWLSCSDVIKHMSQERQIQGFLGLPTPAPTPKGSKIDRTTTGKAETSPIEELMDLQMAVDLGLNISSVKLTKVIRGSAVRTQTGQLINEGSSVVVKNEDEKEIGIFLEGVILKHSKGSISGAKIQKTTRVGEDETTKCLVVKKMEEFFYIKTECIIEACEMFHSCSRCHIKEGNIIRRIEQRDIVVSEKLIKHNGYHDNEYIVNRYRV